MNAEQKKTADRIVGILCLAGLALIGWRWLSAPPSRALGGPERTAVATNAEWRDATDADLKVGTFLYWKTVNGPSPWATVVNGEIRSREDGERLVLVRFSNSVEEWKSVGMVRRSCVVRPSQ